MEACIRRQRRRQESGPPENVQGSQNEGSLSEQNVTEHTVQAAMGEIGYLSLVAMAETRDGNGGLSQQLSLGSMLRSALSLSGADPAQSAIDLHAQSIAVMVDSSMILRRELALPFITRFTETVGVMFLHINPKELLDDVDLISSHDPARNKRELSTVKRFNLYLSVATGALVSPESGGFQGLASNYHSAAMKLYPEILQNGTRVDILHCMLSLIIYSMHSPLGGSSWHLIGLAMNKAIAFGFHKDNDADGRISPEVLGTRRNIFWSLYMLDR